MTAVRAYIQRPTALKKRIVKAYRRAKRGTKKDVLAKYGIALAHIRLWEERLGL